MKLGMYVMAPEHILVAYYVSPSSGYMCITSLAAGQGLGQVCPSFIARQRPSKQVPTVTVLWRTSFSMWLVCFQTKAGFSSQNYLF
jgi:hypothetical protein